MSVKHAFKTGFQSKQQNKDRQYIPLNPRLERHHKYYLFFCTQLANRGWSTNQSTLNWKSETKLLIYEQTAETKKPKNVHHRRIRIYLCRQQKWRRKGFLLKIKARAAVMMFSALISPTQVIEKLWKIRILNYIFFS